MDAIVNAAGQAPELLAPAGGWSQARTALRFGADALYFACERFGMRARSDNFSLDDVAPLVEEVHDAGARAYTTLNTVMSAGDMRALPRYLETLARADVDGFIVGDAGAFSLARRVVPEVPLHISTQMSVSNAEAARFWHEAGATRVVLAREMSLADIAELRANVPDELELEAFVHGAMCVAYSGRCLLSAAMCGRSANRGACAQSCRWGYALVEEQRPGQYFEIEEDAKGSYILNAEDLNMIAHLRELARAGVSSFKIEGRNKRAFYVACVVGAYRSVLDGGSVDAAQCELDTISHRPYGTGFYFGEPNQSHERDGYIREQVHVATVEDCVACDEGERAGAGAGAGGFAPQAAGEDGHVAMKQWRITVRCHNRFAPGDKLGVLAPHRAPRIIKTGALRRYVPQEGGKPFVERGELSLEQIREQGVLVDEEVANRSKEHYVFYLDEPLEVGDYLRRRV